MTGTSENVSWVVERLSTLAWMVGFPDSDQKLIDYARALLPMLQGKKLIYTDPDVEPGERLPLPEGYVRCAFRPPDGVVTDVDWIVHMIGQASERFPMPVQVFRLYQRYFQPENELEVRAAQSALEGE